MGEQRYNPEIHHRHSLRLQTHDYTWTRAYFVTICAKVREPLFDVSELHAILTATWQELPKRFPSMTLDEFVVMPDHVHFIVWLDGLAENAPTLSSIVGAYKSLTTVAWLRHISNKLDIQYPGKFWQRNFVDRIISGPDDLERTRAYIRNNPTKLQQSNK